MEARRFRRFQIIDQSVREFDLHHSFCGIDNEQLLLEAAPFTGIVT
jgi:hypothetical protein